MARKACRVEQRKGGSVDFELRLDRAKRLWIARKLQRQGLVRRKRRCDRFAKADGRQQARRDAAGERRTRSCYNGYAHEQRVACGRVRVAGERVEEDVGKREPRQMIIDVALERRKYQAIGADTAELCFAPQ